MKRDSLLIVPYGIEIYYIQRNGQITPMLLIVPYGIEISLLFQGNGQNAPGLLIVPYGIEIQNRCQTLRNRRLLIVPYGIEISPQEMDYNHARPLLIVPYGIEMTYTLTLKYRNLSFNRTLWN